MCRPPTLACTVTDEQLLPAQTWSEAFQRELELLHLIVKLISKERRRNRLFCHGWATAICFWTAPLEFKRCLEPSKVSIAWNTFLMYRTTRRGGGGGGGKVKKRMHCSFLQYSVQPSHVRSVEHFFSCLGGRVLYHRRMMSTLYQVVMRTRRRMKQVAHGHLFLVFFFQVFYSAFFLLPLFLT